MEQQAIPISASSTSVAPHAHPPSIRFRSIDNLLQAIDSASGDYLVVTDVSADDFAKISLSREKPPSLSQKRRIFRLCRYYTNTNILIITIPTSLHEALHLHLYREYPERATKDAWPTLVIEAGDSESLSELRRDMRWWFSASDHQVKIVLIAKFERTRRRILIEKWEEDPRFRPATQQSVTSTALEPILRQNINIIQNAANSPVSYHVTEGLIVSFSVTILTTYDHIPTPPGYRTKSLLVYRCSAIGSSS
ncbi:hypothetical protein F5Y10DRAFT_264398 [Nemania abortiva]|nr:hypothetical protein F5Y10DRAFT_264398 [Nemania abortiva]